MFPLHSDDDDVDASGSGDCVCVDRNDIRERREKRLQRRFIKKHLATNGRRLRHKFIDGIDAENAAKNRRFRRDDSKNDDQSSDASTDVETVLTDLADQDIVEVDIIMDGIYDEIKDLQVLTNTKASRRGVIAQLVERPSKGPGSRCNSTDVSLNPARGIRWQEKTSHAIWQQLSDIPAYHNHKSSQKPLAGS